MLISSSDAFDLYIWCVLVLCICAVFAIASHIAVTESYSNGILTETKRLSLQR